MAPSIQLVDRAAESDTLHLAAPGSSVGPIIVASDGTEASLPALAAARLLATGGAAVQVVSVLSPTPYVVPWTVVPVYSSDENTARTQQRAAELEAQARAQLGRSPAQVEVPLGEPDEVIPTLARERGASLIVTGLRRRGRLDRLMQHGETPLAIARAARTPVLVVPRPLEHLPRVAVFAVALDETSREVARRARPLLAGVEQLFLVHVREEDHVFPGGAAVEREDYYADMTRATLEEVAKILALPPEVTVETRMLVGHRVAELLDFAELVRAELLVAGYRRRLLLDRLTGPADVAERLYRATPCAMLLVPLEAAHELPGGGEGDVSMVEERADWSVQLTALGSRNVGRGVRLEVDAVEIGAQAEAVGYSLLGVDFDDATDTLHLSLGAVGPVATASGTQIVHAIAHPRSIEIRRRPAGEDLALRVTHADGCTLLTFHDRTANPPADRA